MREISLELKRKNVISRASLLYDNKYDYSNVNYRNNQIKIDITCPIHGVFSQTPAYHLQGGGCPKCTGKKLDMASRVLEYKTRMEVFVSKATDKFKGKFNYNDITYFKCNKNIKLNCSIHGDFKVKPTNHISNKNTWGCPKCGKEHKGPNISRTTESAIQDLIKIHGDEYDYSKFIYVKPLDKSVIVCREHGDFNQSYYSHRSGSGCPICASQKQKKPKSTEQFILDSKKIHGDNYIYDKVVYINAHENVIITCSKHGDFKQKPNNHISGHKNGCPECFGDRNRNKGKNK